MRQKLEDIYENGVEAFNKGNYDLAEISFLEILKAHPNFADIQNKMGVIYHQTDRPQLALKAFERALELNPGYTEAALNLAITYSDAGRYEKAREVFETAAKTTASSPRSINPFLRGKLANEHLRLGNLYHELGLLNDAIDEYRRALALSPSFADIVTQLGIALRDSGKHDEAIRQFNKAKEINPHFIPARIHLGVAYYSRGFYGLAEEEWREALKLDPENAAIKTYLSFVRPQSS